MRHSHISEQPVAASILKLKPTDIAPFVQKCVRERSLSALVKELNQSVVSGTPEQREEARKALKHIGFP